MANPLGWVGLGMQAVSNIWNQVNSNKQMRFQREQAQLNRDFQSLEAKKAFERQLGFWNLQNEYNLPSNQVERLRSAGLHPALYMGNGSMAQGLSSVPQASSSSSPSGSMPSISFDPLTLSQSQLNYAAAKQHEELANQTKIDNFTRDIENRTRIKVQGSQIALNFENVHVSREQATKLAKEVDALEQTIQESKSKVKQILSQTNLARSQTIYQDILNAYKSATFTNECRKFAAETNITVEEARFCAQRISLSMLREQAAAASDFATVRHLDTANRLLRSQAIGQKLSNYAQALSNSFDEATFDYKVNLIQQDSDFAQASKYIDLGAQFIGSAIGTIGTFLLGKGVLSKGRTVISGFSPR